MPHTFPLTRTQPRAALAAFVTTLFAGACARPEPAPAGPSLAITVAPLGLADITEAEWSIVVEAGVGAPRTIVWQASGLLSSRFGDGAGALTYVGPCDASTPEHTVTLTLVRLEAGGQPVLADAFRNPTPVARVARCEPNADTSVRFDLTLLRDAGQGFFDVAVTFDDIFCSAKADCVDAEGQPIRLLHDATGARAPTLAFAFACTAGPGQRTHLYLDDLVVRCPGHADVVIDPGLGPGNIDLPGDPAHVFGAAIYRGAEALVGVEKCYWNAAIGLDVARLPPSCTFIASGTAASRPLGGNTTAPWTRYPLVRWSFPVSPALGGQLACGRHGLDDGGGVTTDYTPFGPDGVTFHRSLECATGEVDAIERCGNGALDAGEACDPLLDESGHCGAGCACAGGYGDDGTGGCRFCGDGTLDANEQCETVFDAGDRCSDACVCTGGYVARPGGGCGYCGDGVHQVGLEQCDPGLDPVFCTATCQCLTGTSPTGTPIGSPGSGACDEDL